MNEGQDPCAWLQAQPRPGRAADPARWQVLEGLARRTAAAQGPLRALLWGKLQQRCALLQEPTPAAPTPAAITPSPLTELVAQLALDRPMLRSARVNERSWTRLRVERRLVQAQPNSAQPLGPLNALALLPRALAALNEASPEYLQRLLGYVDALAALAPAGAAEGEPTPARKKPRTRGA
jgi:hypothetical protein